jgi:tRNA A37 threonylcarbamoyladenosine synthetase subunit TsaC/SUA5/YrdC
MTLLEHSGGLLVGTSANKTGQPPSSTALEAYEQLKDNVDVVLDGGSAKLRVSSTVIDLTGKEVKMLRKGPLIIQEL